MNNSVYDVLIIGGGVVGSACARELSRWSLKIGVLEKNLDVCFETSGRNTGVCHGGFAYDPGSLKARLCVEGNRMMGQLAEELGFSFRRCGKVLVGNTDEEYEQLLKVKAQGETNGASGLRMVDEQELHRLVPSVVGKFALFSENSGILDPFMFTVALAENAVQNGAEYFFDNEVTGIERGEDGLWTVETIHALFRSRWVINAAGLGCGRISDMLGITGYRIIGSKDDYIILDRRMGPLVPMPIYTVPSNTYMGIHVSLTTDGNVLLGPTAEETDDLSYYGVARHNLDYLYEEAVKIWPHVDRGDYIRTYCGILPKWIDENGKIGDFKIEIRDDIAPRAVNLVGIESPGLTASVAIARYVIAMMRERETFEVNSSFDPVRPRMPRFAELPPEEQARLIEEDPDWGEVICRCEKVTRAEILRAIHSPLDCTTMAGVKYRTRSMMGRCQGGYCQMRIARMLEDEKGIRPEELVYMRRDGHPFFGTVRDGETSAAPVSGTAHGGEPISAPVSGTVHGGDPAPVPATEAAADTTGGAS